MCTPHVYKYFNWRVCLYVWVNLFCTILRASFMQAIEWFSRVVVHNEIFRIQFTQNRSFNSAWCFLFMGQMVKATLTLPFGATSEIQMFPQYQLCACVSVSYHPLSLSLSSWSWKFDKRLWKLIIWFLVNHWLYYFLQEKNGKVM